MCTFVLLSAVRAEGAGHAYALEITEYLVVRCRSTNGGAGESFALHAAVSGQCIEGAGVDLVATVEERAESIVHILLVTICERRIPRRAVVDNLWDVSQSRGGVC